MAESGLSTLFNQFKLLPNSVPLLSQQTPSNNSAAFVPYHHHHQQTLTDDNTTTTSNMNPQENNNALSSPSEDEETTSPEETKPEVPSQALKPALRRPTISPLQFTPLQSSSSNRNINNTSSSSSTQDVFQSNRVKFLKRRKQAFNEHFLKNLPNAFLAQLLISFKVLIHHAERRDLLFVSEEALQEFLSERIIRDEKLENNYAKSSSFIAATSLTSLPSNSNLLRIPIVTSSSSTSGANNQVSYSDVETLIVPSSGDLPVGKPTSKTNTKAIIAKFNGKERDDNEPTSSSTTPPKSQNHHNIKFEPKYKGVRHDLEKILKEQQKEFIEPLKKQKKAQSTRQRSLSESLLVSQIKKLKQKREHDDAGELLPSNKNSGIIPLASLFKQETTIEEENESSEEESKQNLPPQHCEHCQNMAHAKLKVKPSEQHTKYQYMNWKIENTKSIVDRIKKIIDMNQLFGVRLRSEFLKDCCELWENHIGLQHCFHSYSIFKSPEGGNIFSSLPSIMKWIVNKYLLNMPTKCFHFDKESLLGMEVHASELGEDIATSCESIPPEMSILLNTNFNVHTNTASARDYKFKFELPSSNNFEDLKLSVSSSCLIPTNASSAGSPEWTILGSSFTVPNDNINYSKSDSELVYPVNGGLYASLSKYRASTAMNKDVISAIRPLVLETKEEIKEEKKSSMSPRRLFNFFKSTDSVSNEHEVQVKPEKKKVTKIKKEDTHSVFSVITMGGISPKVSFLKSEWIMCCYASNMVVFVVNLCDYFKTILVKSEFSDQLTEKNKISYSLEKFEQCVNGKYFSELPIVLCFTFVDVFEQAQQYFPMSEKQKSEIEHIVQQLNPAAYGQKATENLPLNIHTKLNQKRKSWHNSCEFVIQQYIHLATAEQRRKQVRDSFVAVNCIDSRTTAKVLINDILFNEDLLSSINELETESVGDRVKNDGPKSDRSHYKKAVELNEKKSNTPDYTQYYLRRCKTTTTKEQPSKITKQRKSINRKGGEKVKQELNRNKRLSWSNNGSIKVKKPEENIVVLDEYANEDEETEETPSTARRRPLFLVVGRQLTLFNNFKQRALKEQVEITREYNRKSTTNNHQQSVGFEEDIVDPQILSTMSYWEKSLREGVASSFLFLIDLIRNLYVSLACLIFYGYRRKNLYGVYKKFGREKAIYLSFQLHLLWISLLCSVIACAVLLPLHLTGTSAENNSEYNYNIVALTSIHRVTDSPIKMIAHIAVLVVFIMITIVFLVSFNRNRFSSSLVLLGEESTDGSELPSKETFIISPFTVVLDGIPGESSQQSIEQFLEENFNDGLSVNSESSKIVKIFHIPNLVDRLNLKDLEEHLERELEHFVFLKSKTNYDPTKRHIVHEMRPLYSDDFRFKLCGCTTYSTNLRTMTTDEAVDYLTLEYADCRRVVEQWNGEYSSTFFNTSQDESISQLRQVKSSGKCFIVFKKREHVEEAMEKNSIMFNGSSSLTLMKLLIEPQDINWHCIDGNSTYFSIRNFCMICLVFLVLLIFSGPPSVLSSLQSLGAPVLESIHLGDLSDFVFHYCPSLLVFCFSKIFPIFFKKITQLEKHLSKSFYSRVLLVRLFAFSVLNMVILPSVWISSAFFVLNILSNEGRDVSLNVMFLPKTIETMISILFQFMIMENVYELVRFGKIVYYIWKTKLNCYRKSRTPTHILKLIKDIKEFDMEENISNMLGVLCLSMIYSFCCPLVMPLSFICIFIKHWFDRCVINEEFSHHSNIDDNENKIDFTSCLRLSKLLIVLVLVTMSIVSMITVFGFTYLFFSDSSFLPHMIVTAIAFGILVLITMIMLFNQNSSVRTSKKEIAEQQEILLESITFSELVQKVLNVETILTFY